MNRKKGLSFPTASLGKLNMNYSHVIWTTFDTWQPHEKRGDWQVLTELYDSNASDFNVSFSKPLLAEYLNNQKVNSLVLSIEDQIIIKDSIVELIESDRVAGGLPVLALGVNNR